MNHPSPADMRMYLDHELPPEQRNDVEQHMTNCRACAEQIEILAARSDRVQRLMTSLAPNAQESPRAARQQLKRMKTTKEFIPMKQRFAFPRAAWVALTVVAVLAVALAFKPVRALAGNLLGLFRVQQVTTLELDENRLSSIRNTAGEAISQLFKDSAKVTRDSQDTQEAADADQAAALAGFDLRTLAEVPEGTKYFVDFGVAFTFTVDEARANEVLAAIGDGDLKLPENTDGAEVDVDVPASVRVSFPCEEIPQALSNCLTFTQMPSPSVTTDANVDLPELAALGLQVMGLDKTQATEMAASIDWGTTLVIPIPYGEVDARTVSVDGVTGQLLTQKGDGEWPGFILVWAKDGMLYLLEGGGDPQPALDLANGVR